LPRAVCQRLGGNGLLNNKLTHLLDNIEFASCGNNIF
jgi:hypothetical protein